MKNIIINIAGAVIILGFVASAWWAGYAAGSSDAEIDRAEVRHHTLEGRIVKVIMRDGTTIWIDANEPRDHSIPFMRQSD
jgi:hypothetical protein